VIRLYVYPGLYCFKSVGQLKTFIQEILPCEAIELIIVAEVCGKIAKTYITQNLSKAIEFCNEVAMLESY